MVAPYWSRRMRRRRDDAMTRAIALSLADANADPYAELRDARSRRRPLLLLLLVLVLLASPWWAKAFGA